MSGRGGAGRGGCMRWSDRCWEGMMKTGFLRMRYFLRTRRMNIPCLMLMRGESARDGWEGWGERVHVMVGSLPRCWEGMMKRDMLWCMLCSRRTGRMNIPCLMLMRREGAEWVLPSCWHATINMTYSLSHGTIRSVSSK